MSGNPGGPGKPSGGLPSGPGGLPQVSGGPGAPQNRVAPLAAAPLAAMAGMGAGPEGRNPSQHSELAALFECPVCFDYVLPPILQVSYKFHDFGCRPLVFGHLFGRMSLILISLFSVMQVTLSALIAGPSSPAAQHAGARSAITSGTSLWRR